MAILCVECRNQEKKWIKSSFLQVGIQLDPLAILIPNGICIVFYRKLSNTYIAGTLAFNNTYQILLK
jgi:hypothetical protein